MSTEPPLFISSLVLRCRLLLWMKCFTMARLRLSAIRKPYCWWRACLWSLQRKQTSTTSTNVSIHYSFMSKSLKSLRLKKHVPHCGQCRLVGILGKPGLPLLMSSHSSAVLYGFLSHFRTCASVCSVSISSSFLFSLLKSDSKFVYLIPTLKVP